MKPFVNSMMGILFFFCVTIALFVYTNPILGILYLIVVYEAIRRSSDYMINPRAVVLEYQPSQAKKPASQKIKNAFELKIVEEENYLDCASELSEESYIY